MYVAATHPKLVVITAPSGSGKTTLVHRLLAACRDLRFSVSACTRPPRPGEKHGVDYYFYDEAHFRDLTDHGAFAEWEMVYPGKYYGTLHSELQRIWDSGHTPLVDIDVKGALALEKVEKAQTLSIFIQAPSLEVLRQRLISRSTETPESLEVRLGKAAYEMSFAPRFDCTIVNDDLEEAASQLFSTVQAFLQGAPVPTAVR